MQSLRGLRLALFGGSRLNTGIMKWLTYLAVALFCGAATVAECPAQSAQSRSSEDVIHAAPKDTTVLGVVQKGGWAMVPLALLSVVTIGFIVFSFLSLRKSSIVTSDFLSAVDAYLKKGDLLGLVAHSSQETQALARIVQTTIQFATRNPNVRFALLREIAETEGSRQASRLFQQVGYLFDIGVIAPMVGLAGTVTGMITSFNIIGIDPSALRPAELANGVAEALIATAGGLVVGIPAMLFYSIFKGRVQGMVSEMEAQATNLLALLEVQHEAGKFDQQIGR